MAVAGDCSCLKEGDDILIIITLGGILSFLIIAGIILFFGYYLFALLAAAIVGVGNAGEGIADVIKQQRFYNHCIREGATYTDRSKVDLIGQLHKIKEPNKVFGRIYIYKHPNEYPEEAAKMRNEKKGRNSKWFSVAIGGIIGAIVGILVYAITKVINEFRGLSPKALRYVFRHNPQDLGMFLFFAVFCAVFGAILGFCFNISKKQYIERKRKKEEILKQIRER